MRQLPAALAGINLQHGLLSHRAELVKTLEADDGRIELRAVTGPDYGRIWDHELVAAVIKIAGNGTGDTRWKVPDALVLAHLMRTGWFRRAHIKSESCYRLRLLLTHRRNLKRKFLDLENAIRH
jgi:hypothetical protein